MFFIDLKLYIIFVFDRGKDMKSLIDKIKNEAYIIDNRIIKVDHFINHMLDSKLVFEIGKEFSKRFEGVTKILTIETSGIPYALATSFYYDFIPVVFAKKIRGAQSSENVFTSSVFSYTKQVKSNISVDKNFLSKDDSVLIIDDFLATGEATRGLIHLVKQSGAKIVGVGVVIEKAYEKGRESMEQEGIDVYALARVLEIKKNKLVFDE